MNDYVKKIEVYLGALENREDILQEILDFVEKYKEEIIEETKKAAKVKEVDILKKQTVNSKRKRERKFKPPNPNFNTKRVKPPKKKSEPLDSGYIYEGSGKKTVQFDSMDVYMLAVNSGELKEKFGGDCYKKYTFKVKI